LLNCSVAARRAADLELAHARRRRGKGHGRGDGGVAAARPRLLCRRTRSSSGDRADRSRRSKRAARSPCSSATVTPRRRALIPTHRHIDFDPAYIAAGDRNARRALAIARELGDDNLEVDALRAANRVEITDDRLGVVERIAASLERRGDLIALNEHLFDSMWTYWHGVRLDDCVHAAIAATALAARLGIPPVQYGTIKSFALVDLGRFDAAWQALEQEVADDDHPFGRAFQHMGRTWWHAAAGDPAQVLTDAPRIFTEAKALQRTWMLPGPSG
jgi:hypothetical protein